MEELQHAESISKITASDPLTKSEYFRVSLRPYLRKGAICFQAEMYKGAQVFHRNVELTNLPQWVEQNLWGKYKQLLVVATDREITYLTSTKGKVTRIERKKEAKIVLRGNDRRKNYIINEGDDVPALVDLGVFTRDGKVVGGMYDKFKQINRFAEILDDVFKNHRGKLTLLDFGCGKSYLTFIVYHYLTKVRNIDAEIIGYDLKADVVANCNALAAKYGYDKLRFAVADVSEPLDVGNVDAVLSLHACDTATDYALYFAVTHNVPYIFSVPCCQHEINNTVVKGNGDLDVLLKYGIVKERVCALLTDSIRAMLLEDAGYKVDVMEFVDLAHSPKNIILRCVRTGKKSSQNAAKIKELADRYKFDQTLYRLLNGDASARKE